MQRATSCCCFANAMNVKETGTATATTVVQTALSGRQQNTIAGGGGTSALKAMPKSPAAHRIEAFVPHCPMAAPAVPKPREAAFLFAARQHNALVECLASNACQPSHVQAGGQWAGADYIDSAGVTANERGVHQVHHTSAVGSRRTWRRVSAHLTLKATDLRGAAVRRQQSEQRAAPPPLRWED
ncbi:hypothetical protein K458DRAFT_433546 [Lentithecium fluviatile CBS 122367]|uniref:Uncharacterized protein n=1 Tax=Lentithecium fluviatile CBS 122367 TaxID=1168545 RepID=A0A6G1IU55_9PLEO|nr:hypothetical protein K458DRAFT_433546 [Lentithecium fluviatile CBS 122367]